MLKQCTRLVNPAGRRPSAASSARRHPARIAHRVEPWRALAPVIFVQPKWQNHGIGLTRRSASAEDVDTVMSPVDQIPFGLSDDNTSAEMINDPSEMIKKAQEAANDSLDSFREPATKTLTDASEAASKAAGAAAERVSASGQAINDAVGSLKETISSSVDVVTKSLDQSVETAANLVGTFQSDIETNLTQLQLTASSELANAVGKVEDSLPPEVKAFVEPVARHPVETLTLLGTFAAAWGVFTLGQNLFSDKSILEPQEALELLETKKPVLLIDIRSELDREESGIPKLRRKAYGKGTAVGSFEVPRRAGKFLNNPSELQAQITATYILGQKQASKDTAFILMGSGSQDCRPVQKALRASGCSQVFVMNGGFPAWSNTGLPVDSAEEATYSVGTVDSLTESAQTLVDEASPMWKPSMYLPLSAALVFVLWTAFNYHYTLQLVGVLGVFATTIVYLAKQYAEAPEQLVGGFGAACMSLYQISKSQASSLLGTLGKSDSVAQEAFSGDAEGKDES